MKGPGKFALRADPHVSRVGADVSDLLSRDTSQLPETAVLQLGAGGARGELGLQMAQRIG